MGRQFLSPHFILLVSSLVCLALSPVSRGADGDLGNGNTAEGLNALASLNGGFNNTAMGNGALFHNTNGGSNTATGSAALNSNVGGFSNTADGYAALSTIPPASTPPPVLLPLIATPTGSDNTAVGYQALKSNTTGPFNTAVGESALFSNTSGHRNTADRRRRNDCQHDWISKHSRRRQRAPQQHRRRAECRRWPGRL